MKDKLPTREFTVERAGQPSEVVTAHAPQFDGGTLILMRYGGSMLWPVAVYAAGSWSRVHATLPTAADLETYAEVAREGAAQQRASQSVLVPQLGNRVQ